MAATQKTNVQDRVLCGKGRAGGCFVPSQQPRNLMRSLGRGFAGKGGWASSRCDHSVSESKERDQIKERSE